VTHLQITLMIAGSILGLIYSALGISAIRYLIESNEIDRSVGWTLWWCYEQKRYSQQGKKLCKYGIVTSSLAITCWVAVYLM
jgi:hypothetical protein